MGGVIRLIVYDYSRSPPRPLAQRLVYRQVARRLTVRAAEPPPVYRPGDKVNLTLVVTDEKGQPGPATLGVAVLDDELYKQSPNLAAGMAAHFLLGKEIEQPDDLGHAGFYLSDDKDAALALDLLLGTHAWRPADVGPPLVFDNLSELQAKYEQSLTDYQQRRTKALYALTVLSFFGALGLMLLVAMLGLLKIVTGLRLWLPSVVAAACCLLIGLVLMNPSRHKISLINAVPFAWFAPPAPAQQTAGKPSADGQEKGPQQYPFTLRDYVHKHVAEPAGVKRDSAQVLYWSPMKAAGADGRARSVSICPIRRPLSTCWSMPTATAGSAAAGWKSSRDRPKGSRRSRGQGRLLGRQLYCRPWVAVQLPPQHSGIRRAGGMSLRGRMIRGSEYSPIHADYEICRQVASGRPEVDASGSPRAGPLP